MAKQICVHFVQDIVNQVPVEYQIQAYLDKHPNYKVNTCSYATTGITREAMVICYDPGVADIAKGPKKDKM